MISLGSYLSAVSASWDDYDGEDLARLLSFEDSHYMSPKLQLEDPYSDVQRALDEPIDDIVSEHLRACFHVANSDFVSAYECQVTLGKSPLFTSY